jgi:glycosyltransferase involved in cell wall biosynthesis
MVGTTDGYAKEAYGEHMKLFDARWSGPHGIGRFATELQHRLPGFSSLPMKGSPSSPADPFALFLHLRRADPTLFFSPGFNPPVGNPCPFVFCVHDLNHLYIKENSNPLKRAYYQHIVRPAIHRARILITGSEFSKSQICEWSGANTGRVVAVGYGVSESFVPEGPRHAEAARPYFLCVGNHKVHKNLVRTLQAFASAYRGTDHMLLFSGTQSEAMEREINRLQVAGQVKFFGGITDARLAELYRGATALVFVSLYEGFGLPIIESMACGTPVLTSTATATPEVAGGAAILVDPLDVEAIADGMRRLADDGGLRRSLRELGFQRTQVYSWEKTGMKVTEALLACV